MAALFARLRDAAGFGTAYSRLPSQGDSGGSPRSSEQDGQRLKVLATVSFYLVVAMAMVMVNKWVLNEIDTPMLFLWVQLFTAVVLLHLAAFTKLITVPQLTRRTCLDLLPLAALNGLGLALNTYCLRFVDASFYQVARGLLLPFTVLLSFLILSIKPSPQILSSIAVVCLGFVVGVFSNGSSSLQSLSTFGMFIGALSSLFSALHAIYVKRCLPYVNNSAIHMSYYSNLLASGIIAPIVILTESSAVVQLISNGGTPLRTFIVGGLITGVMGFLICIAGYLSIQVTSPTTHMISSAMRGVLQTFLGVAIFDDVITFITLTLLGSIYYTWQRDREITREKAAAAPIGGQVGERINLERLDDKDVPAAELNDEELERELDKVIGTKARP